MYDYQRKPKVAGNHGDLSTFRGQPWLEATDKGRDGIQIYFGDDMPQWLWADSPEEVITWLDKMVVRANALKKQMLAMKNRPEVPQLPGRALTRPVPKR